MRFTEHISFHPGNSRVKWLLLSAITIVVLSYYRAWSARTMLVDGHGLSGIPVVIVFFGFLAALSGYSISLYRLWDDDKINISEVKFLGYILIVIFSFMLPMLSNDIV